MASSSFMSHALPAALILGGVGRHHDAVRPGSGGLERACHALPLDISAVSLASVDYRVACRSTE